VVSYLVSRFKDAARPQMEEDESRATDSRVDHSPQNDSHIDSHRTAGRAKSE